MDASRVRTSQVGINQALGRRSSGNQSVRQIDGWEDGCQTDCWLWLWPSQHHPRTLCCRYCFTLYRNLKLSSVFCFCFSCLSASRLLVFFIPLFLARECTASALPQAAFRFPIKLFMQYCDGIHRFIKENSIFALVRLRRERWTAAGAAGHAPSRSFRFKETWLGFSFLLRLRAKRKCVHSFFYSKYVFCPLTHHQFGQERQGETASSTSCCCCSRHTHNPPPPPFLAFHFLTYYLQQGANLLSA